MAADSYIGSLISLTSKSEIRYEGILYNINTEESSIGLRNVTSFGSEGRKKDGPQIMASDKVYEYILFRGSDIKDLQVKTSPPAPPVQQPVQPLNNDPAIIQSQYPRPAPTSNLPAAAPGNAMPGLSTHNQQARPTGPVFQGGMPLYQPDGAMGSWGPSPPPPNGPNVNTSGLGMPPMYWPGFYAPPNGLPLQQSLFRPTPMQNPNFTPSVPGGPPNPSDYSTSLASFSSSMSLLTSTLPSGLPPLPPLLSSTEPLPSFMQTKVPNSVGPTAMPPVSLTTTHTTTSTAINVSVAPASDKSNGLSGVSPAPSLVTPGQLLQSGAQAIHKDVGPVVPAPSFGPFAPALLSGLSAPAPSSGPSAPAPSSGPSAPAPSSGPSAPAPWSGPSAPSPLSGPSAPAPSSGPSAPALSSGPSAPAPLSEPSLPAPSSGPSSAAPSSGPSAAAPSSGPSAPAPAPSSGPSPPAPVPAPETAPNPAPLSEPFTPVLDATETQTPILPLPTQTSTPAKTNGGPYQNRNSYRGRERGRGSGGSRLVMKFTEEFDFTAMNEKFNKDEVWGALGKIKKSNSKENDGNASDDDDFEDENNGYALPKIDVKPVNSKDDFFDTLSCNSNDSRSNNGRTRFSEQMKLDTETFGEFSRYRGGGRGGRGPYRGGRPRGGGYHGRGYGYVNRARGGRNPVHDY